MIDCNVGTGPVQIVLHHALARKEITWRDVLGLPAVHFLNDGGCAEGGGLALDRLCYGAWVWALW